MNKLNFPKSMWKIDPNGLNQWRIGYLQCSLNFSLFAIQKYQKKNGKNRENNNNNNNKQQANTQDDDTVVMLIQFVSYFFFFDALNL